MICNLMLSCGIVIMEQSVTVAVDRGSTLGYNDMAARTSLWLAYAGLVMIRFNTV